MSLNVQQQSKFTAGAVPVLNEKGEVTMQKVKVTRYVTGKRPLFARESSSESDDEDDMIARQTKEEVEVAVTTQSDIVVNEPGVEDRRLRRLRGSLRDSSPPRHIADPEIIEEGSPVRRRRHVESDEEEKSSEDEEEIDEEEMERRRAAIRERALLLAKQQAEEEMMTKEEEQVEELEEESSEYEEYSDSEDETGPRLKPVFVRKNDRITVKEREKLEEAAAKMEDNHKKLLEERKKESLRIASEIANSIETEGKKESDVREGDIINTDDENDEMEYEAWKVRELKRTKRDREERDTLEKERQEVERIHNLNDEERERYFKMNPKAATTNKAPKGKYRFLQKYYHRGAFYLEDDERVLKRDTSAPTLEDHFDKTILPQVMQVKNFGRSGRTKYTHLVDQDTTDFEAAWSHHNPISSKFESLGGGMRQVFQKPSKKKRKAD